MAQLGTLCVQIVLGPGQSRSHQLLNARMRFVCIFDPRRIDEPRGAYTVPQSVRPREESANTLPDADQAGSPTQQTLPALYTREKPPAKTRPKALQ